MKTTRMLRCALFASVLAAFSFVGCEKSEMYTIDSPANLQQKIDSVAYDMLRKKEIADSIAAAKAAALEARLIEDVYQVGATDNSSGWLGGYSKYYRLATNADTVYVKFKNFTSGKNVWANWVQAITNDVPRGGEGYVEYAIWRADNAIKDNMAWGKENGVAWNVGDKGDLHSQQQTTNYSSMATENKNFTEYMNLMNGADCVASITRGGDSVYVDVQMTALSGQKLTKKFYIVERGIKDNPIRIFWTLENCHLVFYKTLTPALDEHIPAFDLNPNWNSGSVDEIVDEEPVASAVTYKAEMTATITTVSNQVFTYTYFAEGLPYGGYGTFLVIEGGHMVLNPTDTYYCALADKDKSSAWYYPYSSATTVGLVDNSTPWWAHFSNYTSVIGEGYFHYKFINNTNGLTNWNNWCLALTNGQNRNSNSYKECFVLRSDNYGWGDYYVVDNLTNDYDWANFTENMKGATVEISLKISAETSAELKSMSVSKALMPGETIE